MKMGKNAKQPIKKEGGTKSKVKRKEKAKQRGARDNAVAVVIIEKIVSRKHRRQTYEDKVAAMNRILLSGSEQDGFRIENFPGKGRGVVATRLFKKGDFVLEYAGDILDFDIAIKREEDREGQDVGGYMFFFYYKEVKMAIDATEEDGRLGRLLNHSRKCNLKSDVVSLNNSPHLVFYAKRDIKPGEELLIDYRERRPKLLKAYPFLRN